MLINYWDLEEDAFMIDKIPLCIEVEDIYFIIGLSWRGELVNFQGKAQGSLSVDDYIRIYCPGKPQEGRDTYPNQECGMSAPRILLFYHCEGSRISLIAPSFSCYNNLSSGLPYHNFFDWCTTLLTNIKKQLTCINKSNTKNFGYGTILCTFFFE